MTLPLRKSKGLEQDAAFPLLQERERRHELPEAHCSVGGFCVGAGMARNRQHLVPLREARAIDLLIGVARLAIESRRFLKVPGFVVQVAKLYQNGVMVVQVGRQRETLERP